MRVVVLGLMLALAGCNTISGAGRDITSVADRVGGWFR